MLRAFSAVEITDEMVLDELERVRESMDLGFSPVDRERMHLTLQFFKSVDSTEVSEITSALETIDMGSFSVKMSGIGAFPSREHIRVVWAGFKEEEELRKLKKQVSDHEVEEDNGNEFKPHVTLMRVRDVSREKKRKLQRMLKDYSDHSFGKVEVNSVKLFESRRTPHGTRYREMFKKEL
jgi:2'-5' RNA ligase